MRVVLAEDPDAHMTHADGFEAVVFTCPKGDGDCIMARFVRDRPAFRLNEEIFIWHGEGEFPNLTLTPSIDAKESKGGPSHWHGFLTNGVAE
jgi:hypothetical protein